MAVCHGRVVKFSPQPSPLRHGRRAASTRGTEAVPPPAPTAGGSPDPSGPGCCRGWGAGGGRALLPARPSAGWDRSVPPRGDSGWGCTGLSGARLAACRWRGLSPHNRIPQPELRTPFPAGAQRPCPWAEPAHTAPGQAGRRVGRREAAPRRPHVTEVPNPHAQCCAPASWVGRPLEQAMSPIPARQENQKLTVWQ